MYFDRQLWFDFKIQISIKYIVMNAKMCIYDDHDVWGSNVPTSKIIKICFIDFLDQSHIYASVLPATHRTLLGVDCSWPGEQDGPLETDDISLEVSITYILLKSYRIDV